MRTRRLLAVLALSLTPAWAGACSRTVVEVPASTATTAGQHSAADEAFATQMIPHHRQAIVMADMALRRSDDGRVRSLARSISAAQAPEIVAMAGWLHVWGVAVPTRTAMGGPMMGGRPSADDMMDESGLARLHSRSGARFDRMFLTMMIDHHQDAVEMARAEMTDGTFAAEVDLAASIETSQTAEIGTMRKMLVERR